MYVLMNIYTLRWIKRQQMTLQFFLRYTQITGPDPILLRDSMLLYTSKVGLD